MTSVGKFSIWYLLMWFVIYLIAHYVIGKEKEKLEKINKTKPGNLQTEKKLKNMTLFFKWFPAMYLVFVIIVLYVS